MERIGPRPEPLGVPPIERKAGGQFDPTALAISELQGPTDLAHEAHIRRLTGPRFKNADFPERNGRIRQPEEQYSGIARAWRAEELEHEDILPGVDPSIDVSNLKPYAPIESDPELDPEAYWQEVTRGQLASPSD